MLANAKLRGDLIAIERDDLLAALKKAHGEFKAIAMLHGIDLSEAISKTGEAIARATGKE